MRFVEWGLVTCGDGALIDLMLLIVRVSGGAARVCVAGRRPACGSRKVLMAR